MNSYGKTMTISELSERTNVPISTIKFYIRNNLIPSPIKTRETRAFYTQKHLNRINLIQKLKKDAKISLNKIKDIINTINDNGEFEDVYNVKSPLHQKTSIIEVATDIFREKGYDSTSVEDIIQAVGIGKSSFYKHFKNKKEIFLECIQNIIQKESYKLDITDANDEKDILKVFNKHAEALTMLTPLWRDMVNMIRSAAASNPEEFSGKLEEVIQLRIKLYQKRIKKGIQQGLLENLNDNVLAIMILGIQEYCYEYLVKKLDSEFQKKELLEEVKKIVLYGVLKKK